MKNPQIDPEFDSQFWDTVHERVERVNELTSGELARAQAQMLAEAEEAEVVPVFPQPFWTRVNKRAAKVRQMALDELADAEDRGFNQ